MGFRISLGNEAVVDERLAVILHDSLSVAGARCANPISAAVQIDSDRTVPPRRIRLERRQIIVEQPEVLKGVLAAWPLGSLLGSLLSLQAVWSIDPVTVFRG